MGMFDFNPNTKNDAYLSTLRIPNMYFAPVRAVTCIRFNFRGLELYALGYAKWGSARKASINLQYRELYPDTVNEYIPIRYLNAPYLNISLLISPTPAIDRYARVSETAAKIDKRRKIAIGRVITNFRKYRT